MGQKLKILLLHSCWRWGCSIWGRHSHWWNCWFICQLCLGACSCKGSTHLFAWFAFQF